MTLVRLTSAVVVLIGLHGCGSPSHGPATRVLIANSYYRYTSMGVDLVDRETVRESLLSDAQGREWTESSVVNSESMTMSQVEATLFEEALQKTALNAE